MSEKGEVDLVVVTMAFDAADRAAVEALLARYVVLARGHEGCRNIDLVTSATRPGRGARSSFSIFIASITTTG